MKNYLLCFALLLSGQLAISQSSWNPLVIGSEVPSLKFTDYILNVPKDTNFDKKFKVLEFWASWCAPCLDAVPHLNELQAEFKKEKNLVFLSVNYENRQKIESVLKKVKFETAVVSDQSKDLWRTFKVENEGVISIPQTILVDNQNKVYWVGSPTELTADLIRDFLAGKPAPRSESEASTDEKTQKKDEISVSDLWEKYYEKNLYEVFWFEEVPAEKIVNRSNVMMKSSKQAMMVGGNKSLSELLAPLYRVEEYQIRLPEDLKKRKFDLIFKSHKIAQKDSLLQIAENQKAIARILEILNLKAELKTEKQEVYKIEVKQAKKMAKAKEGENTSFTGATATHWNASNISLPDFARMLSGYLGIVIESDDTSGARYDFLIKQSKNIKELEKELAAYGIQLRLGSQELVYYEISEL